MAKSPQSFVTKVSIGAALMYFGALICWSQFYSSYVPQDPQHHHNVADIAPAVGPESKLQNAEKESAVVDRPDTTSTASEEDVDKNVAVSEEISVHSDKDSAPVHQETQHISQPDSQEFVFAPRKNTELWGDVVVPGVGRHGLTFSSAAECFERCRDTRGCNVWVHCDQPGCAGQCWLKWVSNPALAPVQGKGPNVPWTSGAILKDYDDGRPRPPPDPSISRVWLTTALGHIQIELKPEFGSLSSVNYVREVAQGGLCTPGCVFYRAEPQFLLQGGMRSTIPPNKETFPGPIMERGMVGWAGGAAGPDFFIYMAPNKAISWNHDHTVWGQVTNQESLDLIEKLVKVPVEPHSPGTMAMILDPIHFTLSSKPPSD